MCFKFFSDLKKYKEKLRVKKIESMVCSGQAFL